VRTSSFFSVTLSSKSTHFAESSLKISNLFFNLKRFAKMSRVGDSQHGYSLLWLFWNFVGNQFFTNFFGFRRAKTGTEVSRSKGATAVWNSYTTYVYEIQVTKPPNAKTKRIWPHSKQESPVSKLFSLYLNSEAGRELRFSIQNARNSVEIWKIVKSFSLFVIIDFYLEPFNIRSPLFGVFWVNAPAHFKNKLGYAGYCTRVFEIFVLIRWVRHSCIWKCQTETCAG